MTDLPEKDIDALMDDGTVVDAAIKLAVREALRRHKLLGNPVAVWRDGKVCWLQPNEIVLPEEDSGSSIDS